MPGPRAAILLVLAAFFAAAPAALAGGKPDIIHHSAAYTDGGLAVTIRWQSEQPVTQATARAGGALEDIALDAWDDNVRDRDGYHGEAEFYLDIGRVPFDDAFVSYSVTVRDEWGRASRQATGRVRVKARPKQAESGPDSGMVDRHVRRTDEDGEPETMIDKVLEVMERHDTPPVLADAGVNTHQDKRVSLAIQAIDDKGLETITVRILDARGETAAQQDIDAGGTRYQGSTDAFALEAGAYTAVVQATDDGGNTSDELRKRFTVAADPGGLLVSIEPQAAVEAGAMWRVDGGPWRQPGQPLADVAPGDHSVEFKPLEGWETPAAKTVTVTEGEQTQVSGVYGQEFGSIKVTIEPEQARMAGAQWRVDGGDWRHPGDVLPDVPMGPLVVEFKEIEGMVKPGDHSLTMAAPGLAEITGTYTQGQGDLTVVIRPEEAAQAGGQWRVDGGDWKDSTAVVTGLAVGEHRVEFKDVPGWEAPKPFTVGVPIQDTGHGVGTYSTSTGSASAEVTPAAAVQAGAQWKIDNGPWIPVSQDSRQLPPGQYPVQFSDAPGFSAPKGRTVTITGGQVTTVSQHYDQLPRVTIQAPTMALYNSTIRLVINATDKDTGLKNIAYKIPGKSSTTRILHGGPASTSLTIDYKVKTRGTITVKAQALDLYPSVSGWVEKKIYTFQYGGIIDVGVTPESPSKVAVSGKLKISGVLENLATRDFRIPRLTLAKNDGSGSYAAKTVTHSHTVDDVTAMAGGGYSTMVVLVDTSGSMRGQDADSSGTTRIAAAKQAVAGLIDELRKAGGPLALCVTGFEAEDGPLDLAQCKPFATTGHYDALKNKVSQMRASGGTPLYESVRNIVDGTSRPAGKLVVIALTDGHPDNFNDVDYLKTSDDAKDFYDVFFVPIGSSIQDRHRKVMYEIASQTGGSMVTVDHNSPGSTREKLINAFVGFAEGATGGYTLIKLTIRLTSKQALFNSGDFKLEFDYELPGGITGEVRDVYFTIP
jgi:hypothetical protein